MKVYYKQCPECLMVQNHRSKQCPNCDFDIAPVRPSSLESEIQNKTGQVVALTSLATLLLLSMIGAAFYVGSNSTNAKQVAVQAVTPANVAQPSPLNSPSPTATVGNSNVFENANVVEV